MPYQGNSYVAPQEAELSKGEKYHYKYYKRRGSTQGNTPEELFQKRLEVEEKYAQIAKDFEDNGIVEMDMLLGSSLIKYCAALIYSESKEEFKLKLGLLANKAEKKGNTDLANTIDTILELPSVTRSVKQSNNNIVNSISNFIQENSDDFESALKARLESFIINKDSSKLYDIISQKMTKREKPKVLDLVKDQINDLGSAKFLKDLLDRFSIDFDIDDSETDFYVTLNNILDDKQEEVRREMTEVLDSKKVSLRALDTFFDAESYDIEFTLGILHEYMETKEWTREYILSQALEIDARDICNALANEAIEEVKDLFAKQKYAEIEAMLAYNKIYNSFVTEAIIFMDTRDLTQFLESDSSFDYPALKKIIDSDYQSRESDIAALFDIDSGEVDVEEVEVALKVSEFNEVFFKQNLTRLDVDKILSMLNYAQENNFDQTYNAIIKYFDFRVNYNIEQDRASHSDCEDETSSCFVRGGARRSSTKSDTSANDSAYFGSSQESGSEPSTPIIGGFAEFGQIGPHEISAH